MKGKIFRVSAIILVIIAMIMAGILLMKNKDLLFLTVIPILAAGMFQKSYIKIKNQTDTNSDKIK